MVDKPVENAKGAEGSGVTVKVYQPDQTDRRNAMLAEMIASYLAEYLNSHRNQGGRKSD